MIIFTNDESVFRNEQYNEVFMYGSLDTIPNRSDTIYYLNTNKFSSEDVLKWHPIVANKLIIITSKIPTLNKKAKEVCIVSDDLLDEKPVDDTFMLIRALVNWNDRERAKKFFKTQPIPLVNWFLKHNYKDIDFWRRMSDVMFILPEEYVKASIIYGIEPSRKRVIWPSKTKKKVEMPDEFRSTDKYWEIILENSICVANNLREVGSVPKGMRKTKVAENKWF